MPARAPGLMIGLITMLVSIGPLTIAIYVPSLTDIRTALHATEAEVQLTVTAYLVGFAFAQLAVGPLSDRFGRRPVLLVGLVIYVATSVACAFSASAGEMTVLRVAQAVGACAGPVVGRAMVRDLFPPDRAPLGFRTGRHCDCDSRRRLPQRWVGNCRPTSAGRRTSSQSR